MKNSELYTELTNSIITILEEQQLSWDKPWICLDEFGGLARNASSGRMYSTINQIILGMVLKKKKYTKNAWLTFKQLNELGGAIKKGEKATAIYFNIYTWKDKDEKKYTWEEVKVLTKEEREELGVKNNYFLTSYLVFNLSQTKDLPEIYYQKPSINYRNTFDINQVVSSLINQFDAEKIISFQDVNEAYYNLKEDHIVMPTQKQFTSEEGFYGTLFHEWVHWTGHQSRLNRTFLLERNKENYAHEELIAELGSVFISAQLGLERNISQNAAYIQSWLEALKEDSRYIMKMISFSERACRFILEKFNIEDSILENPVGESIK